MTPSINQPSGTAADVQGSHPLSGQAPLDSQELLQGRTAVAIAHNGALYRLQTTRQGKLILTK